MRMPVSGARVGGVTIHLAHLRGQTVFHSRSENTETPKMATPHTWEPGEGVSPTNVERDETSDGIW